MKNQVNKGFINYLVIFLVIVGALVLGAGAIMIMSPDVEILGYKYESLNTTATIQNYNGVDLIKNSKVKTQRVDKDGNVIDPVDEKSQTSINFKTLTNLVIETNSMDVKLIFGETDKIVINRNVSGFSKVKDVKDFVTTKHYSSGTLIITTNDTKPILALNDNSSITVHIKNRETTNLNVQVVSSSANLSVATSVFDATKERDLSLKSLKLETKKGSLTVSDKATITNEIFVKSSNKSNINVKKDQALSGSFTANLKDGDVNVENIKALEAELTGDNVNFKGKNLIFNAEKGLSLGIKRGDVTLSKIDGFLSDETGQAENIILKVEEITGKFTMSNTNIKQANKSKIDIGTVKEDIYVKTSSGNIYIKEAESTARIETISGNIYIGTKDTPEALEKYSVYDLKTKTGDIYINADHVHSKNFVDSESGKITFNYLNSLENFEIDATSKKSKFIKFSPGKEHKVVNIKGYPFPLETEKEIPYSDKVTMVTNGKIYISAVSSLKWFV